jgi:diguanylate cyclase
MASDQSRPKAQTRALLAVCSGAVAAAVIGFVCEAATVALGTFAFAFASAVLAQFAQMRWRPSGTRFAWGEAAVIVVVFLLPTEYVPVIMGIGTFVGLSLWLLLNNSRVSIRTAGNVANITLAGFAGAWATRLSVPGWTPDTALSTHVVLGLIAGAVAYTVVGAFLVNVVFEPTTDQVFIRVSRTLRGKLPIIIGNITVGLAIVLLLSTDRAWLLLMPPVVVLLHQLYVYRSSAEDERRAWREFAEIARSLNQLDERGVAVAGIEGAMSLFEAARAEIWVDRLAGPPRGYRGDAGPVGVVLREVRGTTTGQPASVSSAGAHVDDPLPTAVRQLAIGGVRVGEIRIWLVPPSAFGAREQMVFSAISEALAASLHDAAAHRALKALAARSVHDNQHDVLTGIANRTTLEKDGAELLRRCRIDQQVCALVLDLNRFKEVNDTLGHAAGDDLLRVTASRLAAYVDRGDLIARLNGDEFAVLSIADRPDPVDWAKGLADQLAVPTELSGLPLAVEAAVGVAIADAGAVDVVELLRRADVAMYDAKRGASAVAVYGRNNVQSTPPGAERLSILVELREALDSSDQLLLAVQPEVDLATGAPIGVEALVRWRHPNRGPLAPVDFIEVVDRSDLVVPFTRYVLDRALALARDWTDAGVPLPVSVNLSPRSLLDPTLPDDVANLLAMYGLPPHRLILEITEMAAPPGQPLVGEVLAALRAFGVQIAVDDFGTGYSSLSFLTRVQVDEVKVDASFVAAMVESPEAAAIVRTTVDLGRQLGVRVVAEGVETPAQRTALTELGCSAAQGFHFVAPIDAAESLTVLKSLYQA